MILSERAFISGIKQLITMAKTLKSHEFGLLSYYDHPISSGPMEGTNNKIKTLIRQHYGIRDQEFFDLLLYSMRHMKYALTG